MSESKNKAAAREFIESLRVEDIDRCRAVLTEDMSWVLPPSTPEEPFAGKIDDGVLADAARPGDRDEHPATDPARPRSADNASRFVHFTCQFVLAARQGP